MSDMDNIIPDLRFPGQRENEEVKLLVRKHWVIDIKIGALFLLIGVAPLVVYILLMIILWNGEWNDGVLTWALVFSVFLLYMLLVSYIRWLNEELDIIIVTNERIISHDQVSLFHREICETNLDQIQDVRGVEKGFLGNLLHYGELEVQTAAKDIAFDIRSCANPYENSRSILTLRDASMQRRNQNN